MVFVFLLLSMKSSRGEIKLFKQLKTLRNQRKPVKDFLQDS